VPVKIQAERYQRGDDRQRGHDQHVELGERRIVRGRQVQREIARHCIVRPVMAVDQVPAGQGGDLDGLGQLGRVLATAARIVLDQLRVIAAAGVHPVAVSVIGPGAG